MQTKSFCSLNQQKFPIKVWLAFAAVALFWGTTFLGMRIGIQTFPPFLLAGLRHTIGGVIICSYFLLRGYKIPDKKELKVFAINGFLMMVCGNGLVCYAEMYISSGLAALICSLTPIWLVLINSTTSKTESINKITIAGFLLCFLAQFLLFKDHIKELGNTQYLYGIIAVTIANFCWALGSIYSKQHKYEINSLYAAGLQMIFGGIMLDIYSISTGDLNNLNPSSESIYALAYLIIFGSIIAYGSYIYILKNMPAAIVSTYAYINTIVAVILGWLWFNEIMNLQMAFAVLLTLFGLWLVNKSMNKT